MSSNGSLLISPSEARSNKGAAQSPRLIEKRCAQKNKQCKKCLGLEETLAQKEADLKMKGKECALKDEQIAELQSRIDELLIKIRMRSQSDDCESSPSALSLRRNNLELLPQPKAETSTKVADLFSQRQSFDALSDMSFEPLQSFHGSELNGLVFSPPPPIAHPTACPPTLTPSSSASYPSPYHMLLSSSTVDNRPELARIQEGATGSSEDDTAHASDKTTNPQPASGTSSRESDGGSPTELKRSKAHSGVPLEDDRTTAVKGISVPSRADADDTERASEVSSDYANLIQPSGQEPPVEPITLSRESKQSDATFDRRLRQ